MDASIEFADYKIIRSIEQKNGCFTKKVIWISGWRHELTKKFERIRFIHGLTGKETEIKIDEIRPNVVFEVKS